MIRKLRLKFVAVCMAMVTAVLAVVCFAIFAALRGNVEDLSREVLHRVIQEDPGGRRPEIGVEIGGDKVLLPYFTVSVWPGGGGAYTAYVTGGTYAALEDTAELTAILEDCLGQEPPEGVIQSYSLRYLRRDNGLYQRMAFVDMSMERAMLREMMGSYLRIALAAFLLLREADGLTSLKRPIQLKKQAAAYLPAYMIPRKLLVVESFPLNVNGKIDKKALAASLEEGAP